MLSLRFVASLQHASGEVCANSGGVGQVPRWRGKEERWITESIGEESVRLGESVSGPGEAGQRDGRKEREGSVLGPGPGSGEVGRVRWSGPGGQRQESQKTVIQSRLDLDKLSRHGRAI